jgi:hypothetical protein
MGRSMIWIAGLFNSDARESGEMLYQLENEYLFDSSKFEEHFFSPTPYEEGIRETARRT